MSDVNCPSGSARSGGVPPVCTRAISRSGSHLGIHPASCQAVATLPADADLEGHPPAQDDVAQLLRSAEDLTRSIPVLDQTAGISQLVVALCDLVREATP